MKGGTDRSQLADMLRYADALVTFGGDPDNPEYSRFGYASARPLCQLNVAEELRKIADDIEADHAAGCDTKKAGR